MVGLGLLLVKTLKSPAKLGYCRCHWTALRNQRASSLTRYRFIHAYYEQIRLIPCTSRPSEASELVGNTQKGVFAAESPHVSQH